MTDTTIHSRAVLVSLSISSWAARKFDRVVSEETTRAHGAKADAGRFNKVLMPAKEVAGADAYYDLIALVQDTRKWHYANTLPWTDGTSGWRLLPSANFMQYSDHTRRVAADFERMADTFEVAYPYLREKARERLSDLWREQDYPSIAEIRRKFAFRLEYAPLPAHGDFRLDLPSATLNDLESQVQDRITRATQAAAADCWERLHTVVSNMHERLTDERTGIFRDTLVTNVRDLVDVLARLNVTDDPQLEQMRVRVMTQLAVHEPQTLRDDPEVRQDTAAKAAAILDAMSAVYGGAR